MHENNHEFSIEKIIELVEKWLITGELNVDMLSDNFQFVSPFWKSNTKTEFVNKFQDSTLYQAVSLSKIIKFDPLIRLKGLDGKHFAIALQYHTKNGGSVDEAVWGKVSDNGLLTELRSIYDLEATKKALEL